MKELTMPTIISVKQFDTTLSVKIDKSDTDVRELMDLFEKLLLAHGYQKESIDRTICKIADDIRLNKEDDYVKHIMNKYS